MRLSSHPYSLSEGPLIEAALKRFIAQFPQLEDIYQDIALRLRSDPRLLTVRRLPVPAFPSAGQREFFVTLTAVTWITPTFRILFEVKPGNVKLWSIARHTSALISSPDPILFPRR